MKKTLFLILGLALAAPSVSFAWGKGKYAKGAGWTEEAYQEKIDKKLDRMTKHLDLTDDQKGKIRAILESKKEKKVALHKEMQALREKTDSEIKAVLTDDQEAKYQKKFKKKRGKRGRRK